MIDDEHVPAAPGTDTDQKEMLNNDYQQITKKAWNDILRKCLIYVKTPYAKRSLLNVKEIVALKLYTDFDELQREFRACFRQKDSDQRMQRQRQFYFWNSLLEKACKKSQEGIVGKLYHGINDQALVASCFGGTYYGPVSTTTELAVAKGFAGKNGQILELCPSYAAKGLTVSWLSNYPDENEVLYMNVSFQITRIQKLHDVADAHGDDEDGVNFEDCILRALQTINPNAKSISLNETDEYGSQHHAGFTALETYEKFAVLYLLHIQYRPKQWSELVEKANDKRLANAFLKFRDQFISLAESVEAVFMDNMSKMLQLFFYSKSSECKLPILNPDIDLETKQKQLESKYVANKPLYFARIVKLFPSAKQVTISANNFDWSLRRFVEFLESYDFEFHQIELQDIYIRRIDPHGAAQKLRHNKASANIHKLERYGWRFITSVHLHRTDVEPVSEFPFLETFINSRVFSESSGERRASIPVFRTYTKKIMHCDKSDLSATESEDNQQQLEAIDENKGEAEDDETESQETQKSQTENPEEAEEEGFDHFTVDYNPSNCTLSAGMFDKIAYKEKLLEMLQWRRRQCLRGKLDEDDDIAEGLDMEQERIKLKFTAECNSVEALVLSKEEESVPSELTDLFFDVPSTTKLVQAKRTLAFDAVIRMFPNVTDVFVRRSTFKLQDCYKFVKFIRKMEDEHQDLKKLKLKRIFYSKTRPIHDRQVKSVVLKLREIGWNFVKSQQMIHVMSNTN